MLTLQTGRGERECSGASRRDFLRVGALGLGAMTLPNLLAARAAAATGAGSDYVRDKAVVLLYLSGGASHIETFNPNMTAPAPYHSVTGEVKTTVPGLTFGGTFPTLAKHAHEMAIIKSFKHPIGGHEQAHVHVLTGGTDPKGDGSAGASIGSMYSRLRGSTNPRTGLPSYALLTHHEIDGQYRKELGRVRKGSAPGTTGPAFAPFEYHEGGDEDDKRRQSRGGETKSIADDMRLTVDANRLDDRRTLLGKMDRLRRDLDAAGSVAAMDKYQQQAFELVVGSASKSFDISSEDPRLVEAYDTSRIKIGKKKFRPSTLGKQMLMTRRLIEAGAGFVTVHSAGWDMHADGNNPGMVSGMNMLGRTVDKAVSTFLDDLKSRGLLDKVLLVITGDFGRTPKINGKGGRDHWANLGTLAFAGGGICNGQVIGKSDRRNAEPATDPISPANMMATIFHTLFDIGELRLQSGFPSDLLKLVTEGEPIAGLG